MLNISVTLTLTPLPISLSTALTPAAVAGVPAHGDNVPADADHCLLCQVAVVAGHYIAPAPVIVLTFIAVISAVPLPATHLLAAAMPSHDWRSRGPPYRA